MIEVWFVRDDEEHIVEFRVSGHAEFDEYGTDIVCAAVSILVQSAILGLEEHLKLDIDVKIVSGMIGCTLSEIEDYVMRLRADAILETMILGLQGIAEEYADNVKIIEAV